MGVKFLIDSASDILPAEAQTMGVTCIPMQITIENKTYEDGVNLTHRAFYEKLTRCHVLPSTSQISPITYEAYYKRLTAKGDEVVVICLSSCLSGTCQSAQIAAAGFPGKVYVVDSLSASIGQRILLLRGLEFAKAGLSAKSISQALDGEKHKIRLVAMLDTLQCLKRGGRISAATAFAGEVLGIRPAIAIRDGKVVIAGKARNKQGHALLKELIQASGAIDWTKPTASVYSFSNVSLAQFLDSYPELWEGYPPPPAYSLGCTIGTHIGPNGYGIAYFIK